MNKELIIALLLLVNTVLLCANLFVLHSKIEKANRKISKVASVANRAETLAKLNAIELESGASLPDSVRKTRNTVLQAVMLDGEEKLLLKKEDNPEKKNE